MANASLTIDQITLKCLDILELSSPLIRNANKQYDSSFATEGAKIGDELKVRLPDRALVTEGAALGTEDINDKYTTVKITDQTHVALNFTSAELALNIDDFTDRHIKPRISQLGATIEHKIAQRAYAKYYQSVGTPGTAPATSIALLQCNQKLNEMNVDTSGRNLTVNPAANVGLVEGMKGFFNPTSTISKQFKSGMMAEGILGFDEIAMGQGIARHTNGNWGTTPTVTATMTAEGSNTLGISFTGAGSTWKAGDVFTITDVYSVNPQTRESTGSLQQFTVVADVTATTTGTLPISPAIYTSEQALATVDSFPIATAALTFMGTKQLSYPQNLFYHKNSFTLSTADLLLPGGTAMASRKNFNGISMRIVKQYDINSDRMPCRVDVLYGIDVLRPELGGRLWG